MLESMGRLLCVFWHCAMCIDRNELPDQKDNVDVIMRYPDDTVPVEYLRYIGDFINNSYN